MITKVPKVINYDPKMIIIIIMNNTTSISISISINIGFYQRHWYDKRIDNETPSPNMSW